MAKSDSFVFEIELLSGPHDGDVLQLDTAEVIIGRDPSNAVSVKSDTVVSQKHARLRWANGSATIEDLESSFGTFVNGEKISAERDLRQDDVVCVGYTEFVCRAVGHDEDDSCVESRVRETDSQDAI